MPGPGGLLGYLEDQQQPQQQPPVGIFGQGGPSVSFGGGGGPNGPGGGGGGASIPPGLAGYFDQWGNPQLSDPRQVAQQSGISLGQLAGGLFPSGSSAGQIDYNIPSDQGGFFSIQDLFGLTRQPTQVPGMMSVGGRPATSVQQTANIPSIATFNAQLPSTNNWRLLGRGPGWIMRNGNLINMNAPETSRGGYLGADMGNIGASAESGAPGTFTHSDLGTGAWAGMPNNWRGATGWPGQATPYVFDRWPYMTNV